MATVLERAANSVNRVFSLLCIFVALVVSHFGFEGRTLVLIASVPSHCLPFYLIHTVSMLSQTKKIIFQRITINTVFP